MTRVRGKKTKLWNISIPNILPRVKYMYSARWILDLLQILCWLSFAHDMHKLKGNTCPSKAIHRQYVLIVYYYDHCFGEKLVLEDLIHVHNGFSLVGYRTLLRLAL